MPSVAVRLDADMKARLEKLGKARDRSPHYLMKEAIEAYVSREEWRAKEDAIIEERWRHYQLTGEAIPHEEVVAHFEAMIAENKKKREASARRA